MQQNESAKRTKRLSGKRRSADLRTKPATRLPGDETSKKSRTSAEAIDRLR
jgi:hypothetical protein